MCMNMTSHNQLAGNNPDSTLGTMVEIINIFSGIIRKAAYEDDVQLMTVQFTDGSTVQVALIAPVIWTCFKESSNPSAYLKSAVLPNKLTEKGVKFPYPDKPLFAHRCNKKALLNWQ